MEERLQKILARAGYGSRRANEELIMAGRVRVNNQIASLGMKADPVKDTIYVDGTPIGKAMPEFVYIALHKPRNVLSDEDPQDPRQTARGLVDVPGHLFPVGRLDFDSEGLILLTNDGELANRLTHPRYEHEKEYRVLVAARPDEKQMMTWRRGVVLEDGTRTRPATVTFESASGKGAWIRVILKEGKKRQIREVGKTIGLPVVRILRIRIGSLLLGNLKPREWRFLTHKEVEELKQLQQRDKVVKRPVLTHKRQTVEDNFARVMGGQKSPSRPSSRTGSGGTPRRPAEKRSGDETRGSWTPIPSGDDSRGPRSPKPSGDESRGPRTQRPGSGESRGPWTPKPSGDESRGPRSQRPTRGESRGPRTQRPTGGESRGPWTPTPPGGETRGGPEKDRPAGAGRPRPSGRPSARPGGAPRPAQRRRTPSKK